MAFLPSHIIEFTNFSASVELYTGSGIISRASGLRLRGITILLFSSPTLGPLRTIFGTTLLASADPGRIERSPHHVIAHSRKVLHAASADQHNRVLLQIVSDARNVSGNFDSIGKPHTCHLTQRRIRLLRSRGVHTGTNPT